MYLQESFAYRLALQCRLYSDNIMREKISDTLQKHLLEYASWLPFQLLALKRTFAGG